MMIAFDEKDLSKKLKYVKLLNRAYAKFLKNASKNSKYTKVIKELKDALIMVEFNKRLKPSSTTLGYANYIETIGFVIEINKVMETYSAKGKYEFISHELAHVIDMLIRGSNIPRHHDKEWAEIHILMGGKGEATL